jgi:hypothetical protein
MSDITKVCVPWLQTPDKHPTTGEDITKGSPEYRELTQTCKDMINFNLIKMIDPSKTPIITISPIVAFLSAMFVSKRSKKPLHHPHLAAYAEHTNINDNFLDNFDYGFVWHQNQEKWELVPPKTDAKPAANPNTDTEMILISIIGSQPKTLTVNILFHDPMSQSWERFAPLGACGNDEELDRVLLEYLKKKHKIGNYYTPISCPILPGEATSNEKTLYCSVWSLWFLMYRLEHPGSWREKQYSMALGEALKNRTRFNVFVQDYLEFVNTHKSRILQNGADILFDPISMNNDMDDFLAKQIFSIL